jgi:ethanolamine utilization protein EutA
LAQKNEDHYLHEEHDNINFSDMTEAFGLESLLLNSVGITIGSSTTHLLFSRLTVRRTDSRASRFEVVGREVIYRSPIVFTPYVAGVSVDTEKLNDFITGVYKEAGVTPDAIDTGAVIITGYAARKENAESIVNLFSRWAGKFVCATAGPHLEATLAAHGSGAVLRSKLSGKTVMNVDIGGGTSKVVVIEAGKIVETSSLFVGSRVVAKDDSGHIVRIEEAGSRAAQEIGIDLKQGALISVSQQQAIADTLATALFELIERKTLSPFAQALMETPPLQYGGKIDVIMFSGGVAEYIYGHEKADFGDLGLYLGNKIKQHVADSGFSLDHHVPIERIRATVMGASQYSIQVSGNTIFLSAVHALPMRNLQVVKVCIEEKKPTAECITMLVQEALRRYDMDKLGTAIPVALAVNFSPEVAIGPSLLRNLTWGILSAVNGRCAAASPIVLIFDIDIANLVGSILAQKSGHFRDIICLDGIDVGDLDFIDIGMEIQSSRTVPVVVKNLIFSKGSDVSS